MEGTLRLFVPVINLREYGRKCLSGILLIVLVHMLAVSAEKFTVTDKSENVCASIIRYSRGRCIC